MAGGVRIRHWRLCEDQLRERQACHHAGHGAGGSGRVGGKGDVTPPKEIRCGKKKSACSVCGGEENGVRRVNKEKMRTVGYVALIVILALLVIFFDDIKAMFNEAMAEQAGSLVDQLLR